MIAAALNIIDSLSAVIGAGAPSPTVDAPDFAAIMSEITDGQAEALPQRALVPLIRIEPVTSAPLSLDAGRTDHVEQSPFDTVSNAAKDALTLLDEPSLPEPDPFLAVAISFIERLHVAGTTVGPDASAPIKQAANLPATETAPWMAVDAQIAVAAPALFEPDKRPANAPIEQTDLSAVPTTDFRPAVRLPVPHKLALPMAERAATFAPVIADAVRDLAVMAQDKDLRFNVRPEALGPVAVTIERSEAGPTLRLSVETQAAAQAVRQAEPMLNDARGHLPFVQVTVDMSAPDSRNRSPKNMLRPAQSTNEGSDRLQSPQSAPVGRFA